MLGQGSSLITYDFKDFTGYEWYKGEVVKIIGILPNKYIVKGYDVKLLFSKYDKHSINNLFHLSENDNLKKMSRKEALLFAI